MQNLQLQKGLCYEGEMNEMMKKMKKLLTKHVKGTVSPPTVE